MSGLSLADLRLEAEVLLVGVPEGSPLDESTTGLAHLAVRSSVTVMDVEGARDCADRALDAGATPAQVQEVLTLVSGLGVHTLMENTRRLAGLLLDRADPVMDAPRDARRNELWARHVGDDPYWDAFEAEVPGFLDALLRLAPEAFEGFFAYCALPYRTGALPAVTRELLSVCVDATPTHRYLPGMRLHVRTALKLGAGAAAVRGVLDIAESAPPHRGVR